MRSQHQSTWHPSRCMSRRNLCMSLARWSWLLRPFTPPTGGDAMMTTTKASGDGAGVATENTESTANTANTDITTKRRSRAQDNEGLPRRREMAWGTSPFGGNAAL